MVGSGPMASATVVATRLIMVKLELGRQPPQARAEGEECRGHGRRAPIHLLGRGREVLPSAAATGPADPPAPSGREARGDADHPPVVRGDDGGSLVDSLQPLWLMT